MSSSAIIIPDAISPSQSGKEVTANDALQAASPACLFGRCGRTSAALTWGYYGGAIKNNGVISQIASGAISLTASNTNYVEATGAGVVSANIVGFTAGSEPLYTVIAGASTVTSYIDMRVDEPTYGFLSLACTAGGTITLTQAQAACNIIEFTGAIPNATAIVVPASATQIQVENLTTGAFTLTVKTAAGTGVVVPQNKTMILYCNGVNVEDSNTAKQNANEKNASGGYAGLTLLKINFWNAAATFLSFFTNANTAARTYTFQDRDGTIADNTDLVGKAGINGIVSQPFSASGLKVSEAANGKQGVAVLVGGTVTVANTSITAVSRIFLTSQIDGGVVGFLRVTAITVATSFVITSSSATDTSTVAYQIFEPA